MDYHLDKKITFNGNPEHSSLNRWCLNEIDTSGAKIGRDLIPFHWSLFFIGSSLKLVSEVETDKQYNDKHERIPTTTFKNSNAIVGVFHSCLLRNGRFIKNIVDQVSFSMMGTDREIKEFLVCISESTNGNEECQIYGIPSYDSEVDFRNETNPDWLQLDITLLPDKFAKIAEAVRAKKVDSANLRIGGVSGFYSSWSPSITPDFIKVLTNSHEIEGSDDSFKIPLVGEVDSFKLTFNTLNNLNVKPDSQKFDFEKEIKVQELDSEYLDTIIKDAEQLKDESYASVVTASAESTQLLINKLISKLKIPLWFIFGVLVLILLK
jgi:hypothetical protein